MKKLLCILMVCLLALTLCAPALAEDAEPLVGGWTPTEGDPTQIPEEVLTAFAKATEDWEGCTGSECRASISARYTSRWRGRCDHSDPNRLSLAHP